MGNEGHFKPLVILMIQLKDIPIDKIRVLENVRTDLGNLAFLMESIKQEGLKQPIGVWEENDEYILEFGARRLEACKKLGYKTISALVSDKKLTEAEFLLGNMTENLHRVDNSPVEIGRMCMRLMEQHDMTTSEVAVRLGLPLARVESAIRIYKKVPEDMKKHIGYMGRGNVMLKVGKISAAVANRIAQARITDTQRDQLFDAARKKELSLGEIDVAIALINKGNDVEVTLKKVDKCRIYSPRLVVNKAVADSLPQKYNMPLSTILDAMLRGEIPLEKGLVEARILKMMSHTK